MQKECIKMSYDGIELHGRIDAPTHPKAAVVIVHGLCEHYGRYDYLTARLNAQNYTVYRFDHRGHGRSGGTSAYYDDRTQIVKDTNIFVELALADCPDIPVYMFGHSMGGYGAASYGTTYPTKLAGYVLSGAWTRDNRGLAQVDSSLPATATIPNALAEGVCSDTEVGKRYMADPLVRKTMTVGLLRACSDGQSWLKQNASAFTDPVLLMHGGADGLVDPLDSMQMYQEISSEDKSLRIYAGMCHEIFNEYKKDRVIHDAIEWLNDHVAQA